jgi:hypothetical protein
VSLLVLQIAAVAGWGLETKGRPLEVVAAGAASHPTLASGAGRLPTARVVGKHEAP